MLLKTSPERIIVLFSCFFFWGGGVHVTIVFFVCLFLFLGGGVIILGGKGQLPILMSLLFIFGGSQRETANS